MGLTAEFGMGSGVPPSLETPGQYTLVVHTTDEKGIEGSENQTQHGHIPPATRPKGHGCAA